MTLVSENLNKKIQEVKSGLSIGKLNAFVTLKTECELAKRDGQDAVFQNFKGDLECFNGMKLNDVIRVFNKQLNDKYNMMYNVFNTFERKSIEIKASEEKPPRFGGNREGLTNPFLVSSTLGEFITEADFGNLAYDLYYSKGFKDLKFLRFNGNDAARVEEVFSKCFPDKDITDDVLNNHSVNKLLNKCVKSSVTSQHLFKSLMELYFHNLPDGMTYDSKEGKENVFTVYHPDKYFIENLLNRKVTWTKPDGERLVKADKIKKYRDDILDLIEKHNKALEADKEAKNLFKNWNKGKLMDHSQAPTTIPAKAFRDHTKEEVDSKCLNASRRIKELTQEASRLVSEVTDFNVDSKASLFPILNRLLEQDSTFAEILEKKGNYKSKENLLMGNFSAIIVNCLRIPAPFMNKKASESMKSDSCKSEIKDVCKLIDDTCIILNDSSKKIKSELRDERKEQLTKEKKEKVSDEAPKKRGRKAKA